MKPVFQVSSNDCYSACIASLFEIPLEDVPNFFNLVGYGQQEWWDAVRNYMRTLGYGVVSITIGEEQLKNLAGFVVVNGPPKGRTEHMDCNHATIWYAGEMIHDPHPSGLGITQIDTIDLFYPLNPSRLFYMGPQDASASI